MVLIATPVLIKGWGLFFGISLVFYIVTNNFLETVKSLPHNENYLTLYTHAIHALS